MQFWTAFLLGFAGSAHCAGMCGPLALAVPVPAGIRSGFLASRAAYNGGRILTYAALGAIFGAMGQTLMLAGIQRWVSICLGLALLVGLFSSRRLVLLRPVSVLVDKLRQGMGTLLRRRSLGSLFLLGLLNGLLPCGLVYVACAAATATGQLLAGAQYMMFFGLGTAPMLLAISFSGSLVPLTWRPHIRKLVPISVFVVASMLILRGMALGIPYLSPDLAAGHNCCAPK